MAVLTASQLMMTDGDAAFLRVDNRRPPHALEPGVAAAARNCRFDQGKPGPRFGVALDLWGRPDLTEELVTAGNFPAPDAGASWAIAEITGFKRGRPYIWTKGTGHFLSTASTPVDDNIPTAGRVAEDTVFYATQTSYFLWLDLGSVPSWDVSYADNSILGIKSARTCAYTRFSDRSTDSISGILLTREWRDGVGEDGGLGRAWRIVPGNARQEIPLNGHDVWCESRLIPCDNALVLLRQGNERHYFTTAAIGSDQLTLNCDPSWPSTTIRRVKFDSATDEPGESGIAANPTLSITAIDNGADTVTVANHGLTTGKAKYVTDVTGLSGFYFLRAVDTSTLSFHPTAADAAANTNKVAISTLGASPTLSDLAPAIGNYYYAKHEGIGVITLWQDAAATSLRLLFDDTYAAGKFYLELATDPVPYYGNYAPPLLMQPSLLETGFERGFEAAETNKAVASVASDVFTAYNHQLRPGQRVEFTGVTWTGTPTVWYAAPRSDHTFTTYATEATAMADFGTPIAVTSVSAATVKPYGAASTPMPGGTEGYFQNGRLIIVNGQNLLLSDPGDYLHFVQWAQTVPANQGEAGKIRWIKSFGEDALAIGKDTKIIGLIGLSGASTGWAEGTITEQFGGVAPLAALNIGSDVWFASRAGLCTVVRTVAGERLGAPRPVSDAIMLDLREVDWLRPWQQCAAFWNGRLFWAFPSKAQEPSAGEAPVNDRVAVLNFQNQRLFLQQAEVAGEIVGSVRQLDSDSASGPDSWEGIWTGDLLQPYDFARLTINGEERLTFATADGLVCWLHEGWDDNGADIETTLTTRGYFGGKLVTALRGALALETFNPQLTVTARCAGYNEQTTIIEDLTFDGTTYAIAGQADYDPSTSTEATFARPHREDYAPSPEELLVAELDVHQSHTLPLRLRLRDRAVQLEITNTQGSARVVSAQLQGRPVGLSGARAT